MEAHRTRTSALSGRLLARQLLLAIAFASAAHAAEHRTKNFVAYAPTADVAKQVAETAEICRRELAIDWLGRELPNWYRPCPIQVKVGQMGAGGATTFTFHGGEVSGWDMKVQGSLERLLDSVVPHEVSHTIFASHFRRPIPRWADEGAATLIEYVGERKRQEVLLSRVINTSNRIPVDRLLKITEYPSDMQQVYTLYAEGYSLSNFLVQRGGEDGKATFLQFLQDAHERGWAAAIRKHYEFESVRDLEQSWTGWVLAGSPPVRKSGESLADATRGSEGAGAVAASVNPEQQLTPVQSVESSPAVEPAAPVATVAALTPLPMVGRARRDESNSSRLNAPLPGQAALTTASAAGHSQSLALASASRIEPRRTPYPTGGTPRLRQIMQQTAEPADPQLVSTARAADATIQRGQSPDADHWSDYAEFPSASATQGAFR
jgi:hypothetical protein